MATSLSSDWAWLPQDIIDSILNYITEFSDYVSFSSVCSHWRSVALDKGCHTHLQQKQKLNILKTCRNQLPMLLTPTLDNNKDRRRYYSINEKVVYDFPLPVSCKRRICGLSYGWLFTVEESMIVMLLNPFTNQVIYLPEFKDPEDEYEYFDTNYFIQKGILSSDPSRTPNDYEIVVIYGGMCRLAIYKSGDKAWTFLELSEDFVFADIIYRDRQLYGVNNWSGLTCVDVPTGKITSVIETREIDEHYGEQVYLLRSLDGDGGGDLLKIRRQLRPHPNPEMEHRKTVRFSVSKLGQNGQTEWVPIESIGDQVLFLGDNSFSIKTSEFPTFQSNSIYYIDHDIEITSYVCHGADDDTGIFNLSDGSFDSHYKPDPSHQWPTVWIVPNFK